MHYYRSYLRQPARDLRNHMTEAEKKLWSHVRRKQILGIPFYRQKPIERFIVDFYAPKAGLVIEVDGAQHSESDELVKDAERDTILGALGLKVLRFTNTQALEETKAVLEEIEKVVNQRIVLKSPL